MVAHGAGRFTKDIDLLVDDDPANVALVKRALAVLADNAAADVDDTDVRDFEVVRVVDEGIVDLIVARAASATRMWSSTPSRSISAGSSCRSQAPAHWLTVSGRNGQHAQRAAAAAHQFERRRNYDSAGRR